MRVLLGKLPSEQETADFLKRVEKATGLQAERLSTSGEQAAEWAVRGLQAFERQVARLEGFAARVNEQVAEPATEPERPDPADAS